MRILIIFIFLVSNSFANEVSGIKNLVISEEFKKHGDITFFDTKKNLINLNDYKGSLIILNFANLIHHFFHLKTTNHHTFLALYGL